VSDDSSSTRDLSAIEYEGHALVERRRFSQAEITVSSGLRQFPDSAELQYLAAYIDYACGRPKPALQGVKALLSQSPQHYGARVLYAHLLEGEKQLAEAERVWIELLREYPQSAECFAGYGELMLRTLNLGKARRLAQEGLRESPDHAGCLYLASMIDLIDNRSGSQSESLQRMLREHPEQVRSALALVATLTTKGNSRAALRVAQELLRQRPDSPQFLSLVRELKAQTHWSMLPLYPMQRWGWGGAIFVTVFGLVGLRVAERVSPGAYEPLVWIWLAYVIYSWTWPRLLRRWV
jgi:predicted Zn-dependent protease